jgi:hypothetical protein
MICGFLKKKQVILDSEAAGIDYQVLSEPILKFLMAVKESMNAKSLTIESALSKQTTTRTIKNANGNLSIKTIGLDEFWDELFMKLRVQNKGLSSKHLDELKLLICF